jgi:dolichyl-phosphate beta-glucosyltransferase
LELSVILPAYNEEARLERGVRAVLAWLDDHGTQSEVIVVDDGSRDGTRALADRLAGEDARIRVFGFERNRGKGAAVREGVTHAQGDFVLFTDVDQSTPMDEWPRLRAFLGDGYDVVLASREVVGAERVVPQPWYRRSMGYAFMVLRGWVVLPGFIDTQCGFKAFTRAAAADIFTRTKLEGFCFDVEVLAIAVHRGLRVIEVPVHWTDDPRSTVSPVADSWRMFLDFFAIRANRKRGLYD